MGNRDERHISGFGGPAEGGVRDGYKMESSTLAQAKYTARDAKKEASADEGWLARVGHFLRHLISDV